MSLRRPLACLAALTVAVTVLAGCGPDKKDPEPSASGTSQVAAKAATTTKTPSSSSTKKSASPTATSASRDAETWEASGYGVTFSATIPSGWEAGTYQSVPIVRAPTPYEGFRANVNVIIDSVSAGTSIDDVAKSVKSNLTAETGWTSTAPNGSFFTFDGNPAFQIAGRASSGQAAPAQITVSKVMVLIEGPSGPVVVGITSTVHPDDTESQDTIQKMLNTMTLD